MTIEKPVQDPRNALGFDLNHFLALFNARCDVNRQNMPPAVMSSNGVTRSSIAIV